MKTKLFITTILLSLAVSFSAQSSFAKTTLLPIASSAGYPFVCHMGYADSPLGRQYLEGRMLRIYFGYTRLTAEEYLNTSNPAWYNFRGEPVAEGYVDLKYVHDGGYKGTYNLLPASVEVPEGWNLLYRVSYLRKVGGSCYSSADQLVTSYEESPVYFKYGNE